MIATSLISWLYRHLAKPIFFTQDPEGVHDQIIKVGDFLGRHKATRSLVKYIFSYKNQALEQELLGIHFSNPIGLTAGFDKNGELTQILPSVGFGFEEVGSVTGEYCEGNPKPRLWRLPKSKGLVVYYGLKNDGADIISKRLKPLKFEIPVGINIAKTNNQETTDELSSIADYVKGMLAFLEIGDYFTVNISCPNAFGGEPFTTPERLESLLAELDKIEHKKPIFLKLPVDLTLSEVDALIMVATRHKIHGLIAANLTKNRTGSTINQAELKSAGKGGISGRPTFDKSNELISHLYMNYGSKFLIIGSGGIFSAEDAYEKIKRGASLLQLATGMIFEGPQLIGEINRGLVKLLKKDGYKNIGEAIGINNNY